MKNRIYKLLVFVFLCLPLLVKADFNAVVTADSVRVRTGAGTGYSIITNVNSGTPITVVDKTTVAGSGCSNGWLNIKYGNSNGYICSSYVRYQDDEYGNMDTLDWTARVSGNNVAVRSDASSSSTWLDSLSLGVNVDIIDRVVSKGGCQAGYWDKVRYYGDKYGYICENYIVTKKSITVQNSTEKNLTEYEQSLKDKGFPDSYIPYLLDLHLRYPNWEFVAKNTGFDFSYAVNHEENKCFMQTTNDNYRTSSTPAEGASWFNVNTQVIAFYMDPRNWLFEERIFMFEKQDYAEELESVYPALVKRTFGSGALSDDKYTIPIVKAGKANNISPLAIASRIKLEVGPNGSDATSGIEWEWKGQKYSGYYNFFNIGAYEATIDGTFVNPLKRGLLFAAKIIDRDGEPWNDIEVALTEGSRFLANGYINSGQATVYYQKFNVMPGAHYASFTHQYMTNIQAPAIEGNNAFWSYVDGGSIQETFVFEIPVYNNLPVATSLPDPGDNNNYLKEFGIEGYFISPNFDKDVLSYEVFVPSNTTKVKIYAKTESDYANVTGTGEFSLEDAETLFTVTVKSQTKKEKKYSITVKYVLSDMIPNKAMETAGYTIYENTKTKIRYGTTIKNFSNSLFSNGAAGVEIKNASDKVLGNDEYIGTGSKIKLTTANDTSTYDVVVIGDTSGDGQITILDLLQVLKCIKNDITFTEAQLAAADTSGDGKVTILDLLQVLKHIKGDQLL